jgi:hypothetical protein
MWCRLYSAASVAELEKILWAGQAKRKAKKVVLDHT